MTTNPAWDARKTELELPEEIDLQVEVANVGSRTLAILLDLALGGLILFTVYSLSLLFNRNLSDDWMSRFSANALSLILTLLVFGFQWVYFNLFEWLWNGQTPGKRLLGLRVIKADGSPVSGIDVLLRNLSRPIDTVGPMGLIGLVMIFTSRKGQRLGDILGQTMVIHESEIDWSAFDFVAGAPPGTATIRLSPAQWELLDRYLNRRLRLEADIRLRVAHTLFEALKPATRGTDLERSALTPDEWLAELARRT